MPKFSDGKRRLTLYSAVEAHFRLQRMNSNCFELYAVDKLPDDEVVTGDTTGILNIPAHDYFLRGRIAQKRAELADNETEGRTLYGRARANYQMSLNAKGDYICARRFLANVSEKLGEDTEDIEYSAQITPDMNHECPFLDPSYQSVEELVGIVKRAKLHIDEWSPLRDKDQTRRNSETFKKNPA